MGHHRCELLSAEGLLLYSGQRPHPRRSRVAAASMEAVDDFLMRRGKYLCKPILGKSDVHTTKSSQWGEALSMGNPKTTLYSVSAGRVGVQGASIESSTTSSKSNQSPSPLQATFGRCLFIAPVPRPPPASIPGAARSGLLGSRPPDTLYHPPPSFECSQ